MPRVQEIDALVHSDLVVPMMYVTILHRHAYMPAAAKVTGLVSCR